MGILTTSFKSLLIILLLSTISYAQIVGGTTYNPWTGELDKTLDASGATLRGLYVDASGDTMTGDLNMSGNKIELDADGDSYFQHDGNGLVKLYVDGTLQVQWPIAGPSATDVVLLESGDAILLENGTDRILLE